MKQKLGKYESKGITLIVLVITIIVLLILAGVTIAMLTGENGILNKATTAKQKTEQAQNDEENILNNYEDKLNEYTGIDWDTVLANAEMHPEQKTSTAIGVGTDGKAVNLDLWEFNYDIQTNGYALNNEEVLNNDEYGGNNGTRIREKGYEGEFDAETGEIEGAIPAYIKEEEWIPVTSLYNTFYNCEELKIAPEIPSTVTCMWSTFQGCRNLTEGKVGSNVVNLWNCFMDCESLGTSPYLPNTVENMTQTFYQCTSLINITNLPNNIKNMSMTFYKCIKLTAVPDIPDGCVNLGGTFQECISLVSMPEISDSVTSMAMTFYQCSKLKGIKRIGKNVENMEATFYMCTSLEEAPEIPEKVKIMRSTFNGCKSLIKPPSKIPESVVNCIALFLGCENLEGNIEFNASITDDVSTTEDNSLIVGKKSYNECFAGAAINGNGLTISTSNPDLKENDFIILKNIINTKNWSSKINLKI